MKRILIRSVFVAVAIFIAGFHEWTPRADAAITCPYRNLGTPTANFETVVFSWGAKCDNAMWHAEFEVQYEQGGAWHNADCVNTHPCSVVRPTTGWYPAGSNQGGTINFDVLSQAGCSTRWRALIWTVGKGGTSQGPFAGPASMTC